MNVLTTEVKDLKSILSKHPDLNSDKLAVCDRLIENIMGTIKILAN